VILEDLLLKYESDQQVHAVTNNLTVLNVDRLLFDPGRRDATQCSVGPLQGDFHGIFEAGVGPGAELGDASDGTWHDDLLWSQGGEFQLSPSNYWGSA